MKRDELLQHFKDTEKEAIGFYRAIFSGQLLENAEILTGLVIENLKTVAGTVKAQGKENIMFLYFSLLKVEVLERHYSILLQAQDFKWHMDTGQVQLVFPLDFLFGPLNELWDHLLLESKKYVGKINSYDIREIIFQELDIYNSSIAHVLRYTLSDIDKQGWFHEIPKLDYWAIRWGGYKDQTEILVQVDKEVKDQKRFNKGLKKAVVEKDKFVFDYWYKADLKGSYCENINMQFITFDQCEVKDFVFQKGDMVHAKFLGCKLVGCKFINCSLMDADFSNTTLEDVSFKGSDLTNAILPMDSLPYIHLGPEQLQVVYVDGGPQAPTEIAT